MYVHNYIHAYAIKHLFHDMSALFQVGSILQGNIARYAIAGCSCPGNVLYTGTSSVHGNAFQLPWWIFDDFRYLCVFVVCISMYMYICIYIYMDVCLCMYSYVIVALIFEKRSLVEGSVEVHMMAGWMISDQ